MKLAEKKEGKFWQVFLFFLLIRICGVDLEFHSNQLGTKVLLDFFFP